MKRERKEDLMGGSPCSSSRVGERFSAWLSASITSKGDEKGQKRKKDVLRKRSAKGVDPKEATKSVSSSSSVANTGGDGGCTTAVKQREHFSSKEQKRRPTKQISR